MADHILSARGMSFDACFDIKMPDTWTPIFDLSDSESVKKRLRKSDEEISELKKQIEHKVMGRHMGLTTAILYREDRTRPV